MAMNNWRYLELNEYGITVGYSEENGFSYRYSAGDVDYPDLPEVI